MSERDIASLRGRSVILYGADEHEKYSFVVDAAMPTTTAPGLASPRPAPASHRTQRSCQRSLRGTEAPLPARPGGATSRATPRVPQRTIAIEAASGAFIRTAPTVR